jgi:hypothetical protein
VKNQLGIAQVYFILIILGGIIVSVFLVQYTQVFKSKAYSDDELAAYCEEINTRKSQASYPSGAGLIRLPASALDGRFQVVENTVYDTQSGAAFFYIDETDGVIRLRRNIENQNDNGNEEITPTETYIEFENLPQ